MMSNGHKPGIEFSAKSISVTPDGVVCFVADDANAVYEYFSKWIGARFDVSATVDGDARSAGDSPQTS
jgi:hypothetical protein